MNLDDKLLGYKKDNYCSSSEEEDEGGEEAAVERTAETFGNGPKTGPKGVLQDYKRYRQIENEEKKQQAIENMALYKRLAMTCQSANDEKADREKEDDDEFMKEYHMKRMQQMKKEFITTQGKNRPTYGEFYELDKDKFLTAIDKDSSQSTVVVHLCDHNLTSCIRLNKCLAELARQHPHVKFCKIQASSAGLSIKFQLKALPSIQVYRNSILTGNYLKVTDDLDNDFYASDVENFFIERDVLSESLYQESKNQSKIKSSNTVDDSDSD